MTKVLGVIPTRLGSTRIPEKILHDIHGKTLLEWTYERSKGAHLLDDLVVATDSDRIADVVKSFGAEVIMTSVEHKTGTDRAYEAAKKFKKFSPDVVAIIWGDEPLYPASIIDDCVKKLLDDPELVAVAAADNITDPSMLGTDSVVKVVTDKDNRALYISRALIPHWYKGNAPEYYHIIGAMVMRMDFLSKYVSMEQTPLELIESVEQLRIIENGYKLGIIKSNSGNLGVNTPIELQEVIRIIGKKLKRK